MAKPVKTAVKQFLRSMGLEASEENVENLVKASQSEELQQALEKAENEEVVEVSDTNFETGYLFDYNSLTKHFNLVTINYNRDAKTGLPVAVKIDKVESLGDFEPTALRTFNITVAQHLFRKKG
jgi:hypothetical protein